MTIKKLLVFFLFLLSVNGFGKELIYTTLAAKGTCVVQRGDNPDEYIPVKAGVQLFMNDVLIVTGTDTYMGLVGVDGNVIEIKHGGVYRISEMHDEDVVNHVSITKKYATLLMTRPSNSDLYASALTSSTLRAADDQSSIKLNLPQKSKVFSEPIEINWQSESDVNNFMVVVCDMFDAHVFNHTTNLKNYNLDFSSFALKAGTAYKIVVADANVKTNMAAVSIEVPSKSELAKIETDLRIIKKEVPLNSAIGDMVLASYFEEHGLFLNALKYYQLALQKEPNIIEYQNAYNHFLKRIKLS